MAEITGGELKYIATIDTSQLDKSLTDSEGKLQGFSDVVEKSGEKLESVFNSSVIENLKNIGKQSNLTGQELKNAIQNATDFVDGMEIGLKEALKLNEQFAKEIAAVEPGPNRDSLANEWQQINSEIEEAAVTIETLRKYIAEVKVESAPLQTQFNQARQEMEQLVLLGEKGSPKYKQLSEEAARLKQAMSDVATELKLVTDPSGMQNFISILTTASGAVSAAAGVYNLFGKENEKIEQITEKINSLMAIAVGLQGIASQGLQAYTAASNMFTAAQTRLATALGISTVAARALMGVLTLGLAVAIPVVINYISRLIERQREATKTQNELSQAIKDSAGATAQELGELDRLYRVATNVNASMRERLFAVEQLKKAYPGHLGLIRDEIILNGQAKQSYLAVRDAIVKASKARAAQSIIDKRTEDLLVGQEDAKTEIAKLLAQNRRLQGFLNSGRQRQTMGTGLFVAGIEVNQDYTREQAQRAIATNKKAIDDIARGVTADVREYNNSIQHLVKKVDEGTSALFEATTPKDGPKAPTPATPRATTPNSPQTPEEVFLPGSLADLRQKLAEVEEAFVRTNDQITRDSLNGQKVVLEGQIKAIEDRYKVVEATQSEEEKALQKFIEAHQSFEQMKTEITSRYNSIRQGIADSAMDEAEKNRLTAEAFEAEGKEISDAFLKGVADNPEWIEAFGRIETYTIDRLRKLREMLATQLEKMKTNGAAASDIKVVQDQIILMDETLNQRNPFEKIANGFKQMKDAGGDLDELTKGLTGFMEGFNEVSNSILEITGNIGDTFTALGGEADSTFSHILEAVEGTVQGLQTMGEGALQALQGFASGNILQGIAGVTKAISGAVKAVAGWFNGDARREKEIQRQAQLMRELKTAYDELAFAADRAFGSMKYEGQRELIANLQQQKAILEAMINTENSKKKSDKNKVADYKSQIQSINEAVATLQEGIVNDVLQTDVVDAAKRIGDALVENFGRSEDQIKSLEEAANDMIKNLLRNQLNLALQNRMKPILDQLLAASGFNADGTGTFTGLTPEQIEAFKAQVLAAGQDMQSFLDGYASIFGGLEGLETTAQGLKGDIKGMSERTAGALEAQINAMRVNQANSLDVLRNILTQIVLIESHTRKLHNIDKSLSEMNSKIKNGLAGI